ncbi:class I glutamine amidotransferase-like protein [Aureobasidium pullulans]|uniref:Class I glutamine amidotransferase-like protein n=1 Tax=Aureobasidium pullulans TaxID=5580 RepID=A0A4S8UWM7_AURPU|nr:class I glutamine amidotransferase-like protein [Aureobasidium pullulans]THY74996.1 class I glutamine amidotransferase-like protein [Aureobasidium pullulans]
MPTLRIAILECDTPLDKVRNKYGTYGDIFTELLKHGSEELTAEGEEVKVECSSYDVVDKQEYPEDLEKVDAILMTGSKYNSFDNDPWIIKLVEFTREILESQSRIRVLGICFGHQIVGRALGAKVARGEQGWEVSVTPLELTSLGKEIFGVDILSIHQMHQDMVYSYPTGILPLAHTTRCENQGMYAKNRLITVQGHPEFNREMVTHILTARHDAGVFNDEIYKDGIKRVGDTHGGAVIAKAFLQFLLQE